MSLVACCRKGLWAHRSIFIASNTRQKEGKWSKSTNMSYRHVDPTISSEQNPVLMQRILDKNILEALREDFNCKAFIDMQVILLREIQKKQHILLHYPTGSGKSIFVLAGVLNDLVSSCGRDAHRNGQETFGRKGATLMVLPTVALVDQYRHWVEILAKRTPFDVQSFVSFCRERGDRIGKGSKLIVGMPRALLDIEHPSYSRIVLDEIDVLFQPLKDHAPEHVRKKWNQHPPPTIQLLKKLYQKGRGEDFVQVIGSSATINRHIPKMIAQLGLYQPRDQALKITCYSPSDPGILRQLHSPRHLYCLFEQETASMNGKRLHRYLWDYPLMSDAVYYVWDEGCSRPDNMLIFLPHGSSKIELEDALKSRFGSIGVNIVLLDGKTSLTGEKETGAHLTLYLGSEEDARGLDLPWVEHVVLIGMPSDSQAYIHVAGRIGRLSQSGSGRASMTTILHDPLSLPFYYSMLKELGIDASKIK